MINSTCLRISLNVTVRPCDDENLLADGELFFLQGNDSQTPFYETEATTK